MAATNRTRRPADLEMIGGKSKRQRIWESIRRQDNEFALLDIVRAAHIETETVRTYLTCLVNGGVVVQTTVPCHPREPKRYRLERDNGVEAPRLTKSGKPVIQGLATEQMWRTLRMMGGDFNGTELAGFASTASVTVSPVAARDYLNHLERAGYVAIVSKGHGRGTGGVQTRYQFLPGRYTGPRPPMVQRTKSIYDPNLNQVVWQEGIPDDVL